MMTTKRGPVTSIDILRERDLLRARIAHLEHAMRTVVKETEHALANPERNFTTLCRVMNVSRRALEGADDRDPLRSQR